MEEGWGGWGKKNYNKLLIRFIQFMKWVLFFSFG